MWQIGIVVPDRDEAMATMSDVFGVTWIHALRNLDIMHGDQPQTLDLEIALAQQGPLHLELIGANEGSPWWPGHGLDHVAYWHDDLVGTAQRMEAAGFTREVSYQGEQQPNGFAYHRAPSGLRVEHVDEARRPAMMSWIAGGAYPDIAGGGPEEFIETATDPAYAGDGPVIGEAFHVGAVVANLERGMAELSEALRLEWHPIQERTMHVQTADGVVSSVDARFSYSKQAPHIELLQGDPGSIWGPEHAGIHHIGVWTDDLEKDSASLAAKGWGVEATLASRSGRAVNGFSYQRSPLGIRIELVPTASKPAFDNWFSGGDFVMPQA